jgi:hypothetical protein
MESILTPGTLIATGIGAAMPTNKLDPEEDAKKRVKNIITGAAVGATIGTGAELGNNINLVRHGYGLGALTGKLKYDTPLGKAPIKLTRGNEAGSTWITKTVKTANDVKNINARMNPAYHGFDPNKSKAVALHEIGHNFDPTNTITEKHLKILGISVNEFKKMSDNQKTEVRFRIAKKLLPNLEAKDYGQYGEHWADKWSIEHGADKEKMTKALVDMHNTDFDPYAKKLRASYKADYLSRLNKYKSEGKGDGKLGFDLNSDGKISEDEYHTVNELLSNKGNNTHLNAMIDKHVASARKQYITDRMREYRGDKNIKPTDEHIKNAENISKYLHEQQLTSGLGALGAAALTATGYGLTGHGPLRKLAVSEMGKRRVATHYNDKVNKIRTKLEELKSDNKLTDKKNIKLTKKLNIANYNKDRYLNKADNQLGKKIDKLSTKLNKVRSEYDFIKASRLNRKISDLKLRKGKLD